MPEARRSFSWRLIASFFGLIAGVSMLWGLVSYRKQNVLLVDKPISLKPGRSETMFSLHRHGDYAVYFSSPNLSAQCDEYWGPKTRWVLYKGGQVVSRSDLEDAYLGGGFEGDTGEYSLEFDVVSDANCRMGAQANLVVELWGNDRDDFDADAFWIQTVAVLLLFVGVGLILVHPRNTSSGEQMELVSLAFPRAWGITGFKVRNPIPRRRTTLNPAAALPIAALASSLTSFAILMPVWVMVTGMGRVATGLRAHLVRPGILSTRPALGSNGLLIYLDVNGKLYFDGKLTTLGKLPAALDYEFARRPDRWVYVEADSDIQYSAVIGAIDAVRSVGGNVIMLTTNTRAEASAAPH